MGPSQHITPRPACDWAKRKEENIIVKILLYTIKAPFAQLRWWFLVSLFPLEPELADPDQSESMADSHREPFPEILKREYENIGNYIGPETSAPSSVVSQTGLERTPFSQAKPL